jgi:hypothetical protein
MTPGMLVRCKCGRLVIAGQRCVCGYRTWDDYKENQK